MSFCTRTLADVPIGWDARWCDFKIWTSSFLLFVNNMHLKRGSYHHTLSLDGIVPISYGLARPLAP